MRGTEKKRERGANRIAHRGGLGRRRVRVSVPRERPEDVPAAAVGGPALKKENAQVHVCVLSSFAAHVPPFKRLASLRACVSSIAAAAAARLGFRYGEMASGAGSKAASIAASPRSTSPSAVPLPKYPRHALAAP